MGKRIITKSADNIVSAGQKHLPKVKFQSIKLKKEEFILSVLIITRSPLI